MPRQAAAALTLLLLMTTVYSFTCHLARWSGGRERQGGRVGSPDCASDALPVGSDQPILGETVVC